MNEERKLEEEYENFDALKNDVVKLPGEWILAMNTKVNLVVIAKAVQEEVLAPPYDKTVYKILDNGRLKGIPAIKIQQEIVERLIKYIDPAKILMTVTNSLSPNELFDLYERVKDNEGKEPKVREKGGCYELVIGGKKGKPFYLVVSP